MDIVAFKSCAESRVMWIETVRNREKRNKYLVVRILFGLEQFGLEQGQEVVNDVCCDFFFGF